MNIAIRMPIVQGDEAAGRRCGLLFDGRPALEDGNGKVVLTTLMYVSVSRLDPATATDTVDRIVAAARVSNAATGITGALVYTERHFVQVLEGDDAAIDALMVKLRADSRHEKLIVTIRAPLSVRMFENWDLAYSGAAHFFRRRVAPLLDEADPDGQRRAAHALLDVMYRFTKD